MLHVSYKILTLEVLSTALNSLIAGLTSLKIWSTKSAKKRHLCASISAHSLHGFRYLGKYRYKAGVRSWPILSHLTNSITKMISINTFSIWDGREDPSDIKKTRQITLSNNYLMLFDDFFKTQNYKTNHLRRKWGPLQGLVWFIVYFRWRG